MSKNLLNRRNLMLTALAASAAGVVGWQYNARPGQTPLVSMQAVAEEAAPAATPALALPEVKEMFLGNPDAAVTVIEYGSFTCPHCAAFSNDVFPLLKAEYIDTGKIKFIYREVYFDRLGLWAGMLARCQGGLRYFGVADLLYANQSDWVQKESPQEIVEAMYALGRQTGLTDAQMETCIQDQPMAEALVAEFQKNFDADKVEGTPTFILNGTKFTNMPWDEFKGELDKLLAM